MLTTPSNSALRLNLLPLAEGNAPRILNVVEQLVSNIKPPHSCIALCWAFPLANRKVALHCAGLANRIVALHCAGLANRKVALHCAGLSPLRGVDFEFARIQKTGWFTTGYILFAVGLHIPNKKIQHNHCTNNSPYKRGHINAPAWNNIDFLYKTRNYCLHNAYYKIQTLHWLFFLTIDYCLTYIAPK